MSEYDFLQAINIEIAPALKVIKVKIGSREGDYFKVILSSDEYADTGIININDKFMELVAELSAEYIGKPPRYNNTRMLFWFN